MRKDWAKERVAEGPHDWWPRCRLRPSFRSPPSPCNLWGLRGPSAGLSRPQTGLCLWSCYPKCPPCPPHAPQMCATGSKTTVAVVCIRRCCICHQAQIAAGYLANRHPMHRVSGVSFRRTGIAVVVGTGFPLCSGEALSLRSIRTNATHFASENVPTNLYKY